MVVVDSEVVHDNDLSRHECWDERVLDVRKKGRAGDAALVHHASAGVHTSGRHGSDQTDLTLAPLRGCVGHSSAAYHPSVEPCQPQPAARFIYKY